jgi:hypothetical protein
LTRLLEGRTLTVGMAKILTLLRNSHV